MKENFWKINIICGILNLLSIYYMLKLDGNKMSVDETLIWMFSQMLLLMLISTIIKVTAFSKE